MGEGSGSLEPPFNGDRSANSWWLPCASALGYFPALEVGEGSSGLRFRKRHLRAWAQGRGPVGHPGRLQGLGAGRFLGYKRQCRCHLSPPHPGPPALLPDSSRQVCVCLCVCVCWGPRRVRRAERRSMWGWPAEGTVGLRAGTAPASPCPCQERAGRWAAAAPPCPRASPPSPSPRPPQDTQPRTSSGSPGLAAQ